MNETNEMWRTLRAQQQAERDARQQRVEVTPNKLAIRTRLESGDLLVFAKLGERGTTLRLR